jgi:PKHD-type hydroxylase
MKLKNYYWYFQSALSPEVCLKIKNLGLQKIKDCKKQNISTYGTTFNKNEKQSVKNGIPKGELTLQEVKDKTTYARDSEICWLSEQWIYDLIIPYVNSANKNAGWDWDIDYFEPFQFTTYTPGGFYSWHSDGNSDNFNRYKMQISGLTPTGGIYVKEKNMVGKIRKISLTINLNESKDYEGGLLKFDFGKHSENHYHECTEIKPQGSIIIFPSFLDHCVTPIISGTRYSLVLWCLGKPWR